MPTYPTTNPAWATPIVVSLEFDTQIVTGKDGTEQRWARHPGKQSWVLPYGMMTLAQRDILLTLFETCKGAYDQTLSLTFGGTTFAGVYFDADALSFTESKPTQFEGSVTLRQVSRTRDSGSVPTDFPALATGAKMQLPYTHSRTFNTVSVKTEGGRYAYPNRDTSLHSWTVGGSVLTDAEAQAIWDCFRYSRGRWASFGFTDPDSTTRYDTCRFGADKLDWHILGAGVNSITSAVQQLL
jgi:hypothetical protein